MCSFVSFLNSFLFIACRHWKILFTLHLNPFSPSCHYFYQYNFWNVLCEFPLNMIGSFAFLNHHTQFGQISINWKFQPAMRQCSWLLGAFWSSWGSILGINLSHSAFLIVGFYLHFKFSFDLQAISSSKNL